MAIGPIAGTRAPLLSGWLGQSTPLAGTRAPILTGWRPPTAPRTADATPVAGPPQQSFEEWLKQQVDRIVQSQREGVERQRQAYLEDLQRQSDLEVARGNALAEALRGLNVPGQIQNIYGNASADIGGLAQGFSGELRKQAEADTATQQRMLAGTGQEGAVRNQGENLGNVLYGAQGYIPAKSMGETGAAFASQAAMEPGFAQRIGAVKGADVYSAGLEQLRQFTDALLEIEQGRPEIEQSFMEQYREQQEAAAPDLEAVRLSDGRLQWFDQKTGQAMSNPFGPKKASSSGVKTVRLADGTYQAVENGKPVGKPFGPARAQSESTASLKTINQGNKVTLVDPHTGRVVKSFPKVSLAKKSSAKPKTYQFTYKGTRYTTDAAGNVINETKLKGSPQAGEVKRVDEGGRLTGRTDGVTPTQARKSKTTAYNWAKLWHQQGEKIALTEDGAPEHLSPKELVAKLVNEGGHPYDIVVRQLARFSPAARQWLKQGVNILTGQSTRAPKSLGNGKALPASWNPTHESSGLGWGTKSAVDLFPGPPGTSVGSPVSGTVVYFHPTGAQGGGSMLIRGDDGQEYWIGHIDQGVPAGTRVNRGSRIAVVSADHANPHVHIDRRYVGSNA